MQFIAHRGHWANSNEKNTLKSFSSAFEIGVGVETDIRDCNGELVVSHDPPRTFDAIKLDDFLKLYCTYSSGGTLALNIKADGLQKDLLSSIRNYGVENYFVFDMSVPDTIGYAKLDMPYATRISEYESENTLSESSEWIWLDAFCGEWYSNDLIQYWLDKGKRVAIVSPELHSRQHLPLWQKLKLLPDLTRVYLCTDFVIRAKEFFDEAND